MENAALLARVSTKSQEDNSSPADQLQRGREYCREKKYNIVAERTEIISGSFVLARSVYNELLNMAGDGQITVVVVDIPDRLGRGDVIAKLELLAQLNGARVEYAQPGRDTSTIEGLVQHSAEQMVSGIERMNIRRRTMGGKRAWAERGRIIANPQPPYGYEYYDERDGRAHKINCRLVVVQEKARIVERMFHMCANERLSTWQVVNVLNNDGIPSPTGKLWSRNTVHRILKSETYKGVWRYGKVDQKRIDRIGSVKSVARRRAIDDTVAVPCTAIIDENLWNAAQAQLQLNKEKFRKPAKHQYLLRGRITCQCKRHLCGRFSYSTLGDTTARNGRRGYRYYVCTRKSDIVNRGCSSINVRADIIEPVVWNVVHDVLLDVDKVIAQVKRNRESSSGNRGRIEQTIVATRTLIVKAQIRLKRFRKLYGDGNLSESEYLEEKRGIDAELNRLEAEITVCRKRQSETPEMTADMEADLRRLQARITPLLSPTSPYEVRRQVIEMMDIRCDYNSDAGKVVVKGLLGGITETCTLSHVSSYASA